MQEPPPQPAWTRETAWRQGHVLRTDTAAALGLSHPTDTAATCVVVIGHDCDIANDNLDVEPDIEAIVGHITTLDNACRWGRSPRKLHLVMSRMSRLVAVELVATDKKRLPKTELVSHAHDPDFVLEPAELNVLRSWLAVRYRRAAFANEFENTMTRLKLHTKLEQTLKQYGDVVSSVFFSVDGGKEINHADGSPYDLRITLAFVPGQDPQTADERATAASAEVEGFFAEKCFDPKQETWTGIRLGGCVSISEDDLTMSQARKLMEWRLEYMSLRTDPAQPGPRAE